jgi:predicted nucleotidyltransferase component of viral defense system
LHFEILPKATKRALDFLFGQTWLKQSGWYLAGGTALALQVGHRESVDLDFFNPSSDFSEGRLIKRFEKVGWSTTFTKEATIYGKLLGAKVSFIGYPFFVPREEPLWYGKVKILHERDIAVMKIIALSQRGKKRDFVDLYWYAQNREPLDEVMMRVARQYPNRDHNIHHFLRSLMYFEDAEGDIMPPLHFKADWPKIKAYFNREVPGMAKRILRLQ